MKSKRWKTLVHNGVLFQPPYRRSKARLFFKKKALRLSDEAHEAAYLFSRCMNGPLVDDPLFVENFLDDLRKLLGGDAPPATAPWTEYDFSEFVAFPPPKVAPEKSDKHGFCVLDGRKEKLINFVVEPAGLFRGRGSNPLTGRIRRRIVPEDVTLNLSKGAPVPRPNVGGSWGSVVENRGVIWVASWRDPLTKITKYCFPARESGIRGKQDRSKFDMALRLGQRVAAVRKKYRGLLGSGDRVERQLATATYLVDTLLIRVGNERIRGEVVGVTNLKKKHLRLGPTCVGVLDFLGKDSIRFHRKVALGSAVCRNLLEAMEGKRDEDELFDLVSSKTLNRFLQSLMKGLTGKVFRTYNASKMYQDLLDKVSSQDEETVLQKLEEATRVVAEACNHRRAKPASSKQLRKLQAQLAATTDKRKAEALRRALKKLRAAKDLNLSTSRDNYIDPRVTVAFLRRKGVAPERVFTPQQVRVFQWALKDKAEVRYQ